MMNLIATIIVVLLLNPLNSFLTEQKNFERVRTAIKDKEAIIKSNLNKNDLTLTDFHLLIVAYKLSDEMELYAKSKSSSSYKKIAVYKVCQRSGEPGPKRKGGDYQVPEGFYHVNRFNPSSNFYLSLGLNYPNASDKIKGVKGNLGGDIFIHGSCVTIGCLPMTDDKIKEIYLYALHAKNNGQDKIPVYIFPFRMTDDNFSKYQRELNPDKPLISFWKNLQDGYKLFTSEKKEIKFNVNRSGNYIYAE